jgi:pyruvate dehydrogenase E2 component (dihydrolipoamide acetyltransferase)
VPRPIVVPSMSMYMEEGVLTTWLRPAGARVDAGEPIAEITTEKVTFEVPAPDSGLLHPVAEAGTTLRVEALMGYILAEGEDAPAAAAGSGQHVAAPAGATSDVRPASVAADAPVRATPAARRLAAQAGADLAHVTGTGPGGRIVETDVLAHISARHEAPAVPLLDGYRLGQRVALTGIRRVVAERLRYSLATAASTTLTREADADVLVTARQRLGQSSGEAAPPYDALFIKVFAAALRRCPELNTVVDGDSLVVLQEIHVGFAVPAPGGLVVPVVRHADLASLAEVARAVGELTGRAHAGRLRPVDTEGGTATITNLGGHGIDGFTPILNPPQSVILGIGRIAARPVVREGVLGVGRTCVLSLTFDHRVADGAPAARLLGEVVHRMNDESFLLTC